ncbi:hypothetical protein Fcan01_17940 [Folsomia candida]|uniref:Uncharacterized protein n=1 Tax=Folsomia candida TaxID=158441 RepID=A0A226DRJ0_FOLCA|nr:hypothetical protein Fcan01_17940 [Folsomia candida]
MKAIFRKSKKKFPPALARDQPFFIALLRTTGVDFWLSKFTVRLFYSPLATPLFHMPTMDSPKEILTRDPNLKVFPSDKGKHYVATYKGYFYTYHKDGTPRKLLENYI